QVVGLPDMHEVRLELLPLVARLHPPLLHTVPDPIARDVDRTDFLAGATAGAPPRLPRELLSGFHLAPEEEIQRSAHLVLAEREDPAARRSALPARFLVRRAHGDTVAAHRTRVDIFLNGRHLRKARHSIPPGQVRSSSSCRA